MTTITIPLDVAEAAAEALCNFVSDHGWADSDMQAMDNLDSYIARHKAIRAELAKPVEPVTPVAWIDDFGSVFPIGARKGAESWIESWIAANQRNWKPLYLHPPTPAWCDAPEVAALKAERDAAMKDAERYRWLRNHGDSGCTGKDGYGGQELLIDERLDAAIDASIAKAEGKTE